MSGKQREENKLSSRHISLVCQKFVPNDRVAILTLRNKKAAKYLILNGFCIYGAPREIRTPDPQVRSLVLYPAELWALVAAGRIMVIRLGAVKYCLLSF